MVSFIDILLILIIVILSVVLYKVDLMSKRRDQDLGYDIYKIREQINHLSDDRK